LARGANRTPPDAEADPAAIEDAIGMPTMIRNDGDAVATATA
jgi:hypothetical protein